MINSVSSFVMAPAISAKPMGRIRFAHQTGTRFTQGLLVSLFSRFERSLATTSESPLAIPGFSRSAASIRRR
jgi:hypothetical protein